MERKERKNDKGPLVYWYKPVPAMDERIAPPILGKVDVLDKFRAVERPLDGDLNVMSSLLDYVFYDLFGRLEVDIHPGGGNPVQHLVEQEERWYR